MRLLPIVVTYITHKSTLYWSPKQMSGRILPDMNRSISAETIYRCILQDKFTSGTLDTY